MPILWTALLTAAVLVAHRAIPNGTGNLGSLVEAFLPWFGLAVPVLLTLAAVRRSLLGIGATLLPLAAWFAGFGGHLLPRDTGAPDLIVVQHNVSDENPDPAATGRALLRARPDLIAMEEVLPEAVPAYAS